jgi:hypothetical protein
LPCGAKLKQCCDTDVKLDISAASFGAGLCFFIRPDTYDSLGRAIYRARDGQFIIGTGFISPGAGEDGAYIQHTFTNTEGCPSLLEVILYPIANHVPVTDRAASSNVTFVHWLSTELNSTPQSGGGASSPIVRNVTHNTVTYVGANASGIAGDEITGIGAVYSQENSAPCFMEFYVPAGASVTVYGQWYAIMYQKNAAVGEEVLHGGAALIGRWTKGGKIV